MLCSLEIYLLSLGPTTLSLKCIKQLCRTACIRDLCYLCTGHFLLTNLLLETMKNTARVSHKEGRIVNVSSEGHRFAYSEGVRFDKINDESR